MLEKLCNIVFAEKKQKKIFKLTKISFYCGLALLIAFPLLSKNIKIEEKHLKNTSLFAKKIGNSNFANYATSYFNKKDPNDEILNFCEQIFHNSSNKPYNHVFSKDILSPRGRKLHLIQINLIYDQSLKNIEIMIKSNFIFYALMRFLSDQDNITWLSKDIQFNYITKELFDQNPKECYEILTTGKYNKKLENGRIISAIYNFDLSEFDVEHIYKLLIKGVGINSELVDIDFYRMVLSNIQANFNNNEFYVTTNDPVLSEESKKTIYKILDVFGDVINNFMPKKDYKNKYMYLIENILNNFFLINNQINTNHLLVTHGFNSLFIKTIGKTIPQKPEKLFSTYYKFIGSVLLMIKGMSNEEVDLFRGLYFYLLTSPFQCIGYFYLFLLILMFPRGFFNLIDLIYHNEFKYIWTIDNPFDKKDTKIIEKEINEDDINNNEAYNNNNVNVIYASKIVAALFSAGIAYIFFMINIEPFMKLVNIKSLENAYYFMILIIFTNQLFILTFLNLSKSEEKFIDIIIMYLNILNCWNFVFINVGIGIVMSAIFLSYEFIFLHLKKKKKNPIKIALLLLVLFCILGWNDLIRTMMTNYFNYNNNIYIIITIIVILLTFRLSLFITMLTNKFHRREPWDYDEIIDIDIEEEKNEDADDDKKDKNENKEENNDNDNKEKENDENNENNIENENNINNNNKEENEIIEEKDKKE